MDHRPLAKEIREARQALSAAQDAEEAAERKFKEARERRRIAERRLDQVRQLSDIEGWSR